MVGLAPHATCDQEGKPTCIAGQRGLTGPHPQPAHLRMPEKPARPSSTYSRAGADWKSRAAYAARQRPDSPSKSQKCLLLATPAHTPGRFAPAGTLFAIHEEQGSSTRSSSPYGAALPRPPSPVAHARTALGKSSVTFPKPGAPQEPRQVKYVTAVASSYDSTGMREHDGQSYGSTGKLSRASSVYSMVSRESEGQVHHLSYMQQQPVARY